MAWDAGAVAGFEFDLFAGQRRARTTVRIPDWRVLRRILRRPSLGFGEAYVRGELEVEGQLSDILAGFHLNCVRTSAWQRFLAAAVSYLPDSVRKAVANARHHYDIGNDFYQLWLDPTRTYSCAYFETGQESLEEAQRKKMDLVCRKLRLEPGCRLLDIGCGWGGLIFHAAENYGVLATGVTPSREQACFVRAEAERRGIGQRVQVWEQDWRTLDGVFDRIVSVGMFEHVGRRQYRHFLGRWSRMLADGGCSLLHTIAHRLPQPPDPWIRRYIFPGGDLPTLEQIVRPATAAGLRLVRSENLRPHYFRTLSAWAENYQRVRGEVVRQFGEAFARMWWLYLQASRAAFQWGDLDLLQLELCGRGVELPLSRELPRSQWTARMRSRLVPDGMRIAAQHYDVTARLANRRSLLASSSSDASRFKLSNWTRIGTVVIAPTPSRVQPAARRWSSLRQPDRSSPRPAPSAARVPATIAISGNVKGIRFMGGFSGSRPGDAPRHSARHESCCKLRSSGQRGPAADEYRACRRINDTLLG